jgi:hypothetical protein
VDGRDKPGHDEKAGYFQAAAFSVRLLRRRKARSQRMRPHH